MQASFSLRFSLLVLAGALSAQSAFAAPSFEKDVWPILKENCYGCHSAVEKKAKGGLSLDSQKDFLKGGEDGPVFIAGKPEDSPLVKMVSGSKPEMPKKQSPLSAEEIKFLHDWVADGAKIDAWPTVVDRKVVIPEVYRFAPPVSSVAFSPDGKSLAAACRSEVAIISLDGTDKSAKPRRLPTDCQQITHVEFSPDGKLLAACGGSPAQFGEIRFFEPDTGKVVASRRLTRDTLFRGNFSPDGTCVAVGASDGAVHFVPVDPTVAEHASELHSDWVLDVAYSPDGKWIVSAGRDKATKVSSARTGQLLTTLNMSTEMVMAVASDNLFAVGVDRKGDLTGYEYKVALSGVEVNGSGNGALPLDKRGQYTRAFEAQGNEILDLATDRNHKLVAVATSAGEIRVYKIDDRTRVATVKKVPGVVFGIALDATGSRVAVGTKSGEVLVYEIPSGKLLTSLIPVPVKGK